MRRYLFLTRSNLSTYAASAGMLVCLALLTALYVQPANQRGLAKDYLQPPTLHEPLNGQPDLDSAMPYGPPMLTWHHGTDLYRAAHHISKWNQTTQTWQAISMDLTEVATPGSAGYGVDGITAVATASTDGIWYVGTLAGLLQVKNASGQWQPVHADLPPRTIRAITTDPNTPNGQVAAIGYDGFNTATPDEPGHVYVTVDAGRSWRDVSGNLPDAPVDSLRFTTQNAQMELTAVVQGHIYVMSSPSRWSDVGKG